MALRHEQASPRADKSGRTLPASTNGVTVTVVVPALNEAENLPHVLPLIPTWVHEVILPDDHCTDNTVTVAKNLMDGL